MNPGCLFQIDSKAGNARDPAKCLKCLKFKRTIQSRFQRDPISSIQNRPSNVQHPTSNERNNQYSIQAVSSIEHPVSSFMTRLLRGLRGETTMTEYLNPVLKYNLSPKFFENLRLVCVQEITKANRFNRFAVYGRLSQGRCRVF